MPRIVCSIVALILISTLPTLSYVGGARAGDECFWGAHFGGSSGHVNSSSCNEAGQASVPGYASVPSKVRQVTYGPKLKYRVEYLRQCEPALMNSLGCDANPDPPCSDGSYPLMRLIYAINGPRKGQLVGTSSYCTFEPAVDIPGAEQDVAKVTPERFRELPILASTIISQPENFSLRNGNAHLYADSESQNFNIVIFDQNVRVRAIPTSYSWSYGDGSARTVGFPGEPQGNRGFDEPTSTSHVYKETGDFGVGLTTRFRGEYSTEGGPWTPIPGVANVPSAAVTMSVWRTKKVLVAENCGAEAGAPGCASIFE